MNYIETLKKNIEEFYTKTFIKTILIELCKIDVISYKEDLITQSHSTFVFKNEDGSLYRPLYNSEELLLALDNCTDDVVKVLMEHEFKTPYTYSCLFSFTGDIPPASLTHQNIMTDDLDIKELDFSNNAGTSKAFLHQTEDAIILKYPLKITGYLPRENDNRRDVFYNIICIIDNQNKTLEIRYNQVKTFISASEDNFYVKRVNEVLTNVSSLFNIEITPLNMLPVIQHIKATVVNDDQHMLVVSAQALNHPTGSKAILDTGNNDDMILPFIGNLREILSTNADVFEINQRTLDIKEALESIILEAEYLSDYPWITLAWPNEIKSKVLKIKFLFNYSGQDYTVLQYYGNVADSERMNYVTKFLFENKKQIDAIEFDAQTNTNI